MIKDCCELYKKTYCNNSGKKLQKNIATVLPFKNTLYITAFSLCKVEESTVLGLSQVHPKGSNIVTWHNRIGTTEKNEPLPPEVNIP